MARIHFARNRAPIDVADGVNLMQALLSAEIPVASSCRGEGICQKCRLKVTKNMQNLSIENDREVSLRLQHGIPLDERVSCQITVLGDITIDAPYW